MVMKAVDNACGLGHGGRHTRNRATPVGRQTPGLGPTRLRNARPKPDSGVAITPTAVLGEAVEVLRAGRVGALWRGSVRSCGGGRSWVVRLEVGCPSRTQYQGI
jgi:hypothetical protein